MSLFELRQWGESLLPWWAPFIMPVIALNVWIVYMFYTFVKETYDSYKAKERFKRKKEQNPQKDLTNRPD